MENNDAIRRSLNGDTQAYGCLVSEYQGMVFAMALNMTGRYEDSFDIVQETFLRAYQQLHTLADPARFGSWLYTIAKRATLRFLLDIRRIPLTRQDEALLELIPSDAESPAEIYARNELNGLLWKEVGQLPPKTREAIFLYYMEGFSIARGAAFVGISEDAFKQRLEYGRQKLRDQMAQALGDELRNHQPNDETRKKVMAVLPVGAMLRPLPVKSLGTWGVTVKVASVATGAVILTAAAVLFATGAFRASQAPSSPAATPAAVSESVSPAVPVTPATSSPANEATAATPADTEHSLAGIVVDRVSRQPMAEMRLKLKSTETGVREAVSDAQGRFGFTGLRDGHYDLAAVDGAGQYHASLSKPINVTVNGADIADLVTPMDRGVCIAGQAMDTAGQPVAGIKLALYTLSEPTGIETTSGKDGQFTFANLSPSWYEVRVDRPPYRECRQHVTAFLPKRTMHLVLAPEQTGTVSGAVTNTAGDPLAHMGMQLFNFSVDKQRYCATDESGRFTFTRVPAGKVTIFPSTACMENGKQFDLSGDSPLENVEFEVDQPIRSGRLSGTVIGTDGKPVAAAYICAVPSGSKNEAAATVTDAQGQFILANLEPGGTVNVEYNGTEDLSSAAAVAKVEGVTVPAGHVEVRLGNPAKPASHVHGRVLYDGRPCRQFAICFASGDYVYNRDKMMQPLYDPDGKFTIDSNEPLGNMDVYVEADGWYAFSKPLSQVNLEEPLELNLQRGGLVEGTVVDAQGQPLAGVLVRARGGASSHTISDSAGKFELARMTPYSGIVFDHPDYASLEVPLDDKDGESLSGKTFKMIRGGAVAGKAVDEEGHAIAGAEICVADNIDSFQERAYADLRGLYRVDRIPPGEYSVSLGLQDKVKQVTLADGKTSAVNFGVAGSRVAGTVYVHGQPIAGAYINLTPSGCYLSQRSTAKCSTDNNGRYVVEDVPPGAYQFVVNSARRPVGHVALQITDEENQYQDIHLECGSVTGCIVNPSPGVTMAVSLFDRDFIARAGIAALPIGMAECNENGAFHFAQVPPGAYYAVAMVGDRQPVEAGVDVDVSANEDAGPVEMVIPDTGSLEVAATDAQTGAALSLQGGIVLGNATNPDMPRKVESIEFPGTLPNVTAGTWWLGATLHDKSDNIYVLPAEISVTVQKGATTSVTLSMQRGARVTFSIEDAAHEPVEDFTAQVATDKGAPLAVSCMDNKAAFYAPAGTVNLTLLRDGKPFYTCRQAVGTSEIQETITVDTTNTYTKGNT